LQSPVPVAAVPRTNPPSGYLAAAE
jgi:hypothetical protein